MAPSVTCSTCSSTGSSIIQRVLKEPPDESRNAAFIITMSMAVGMACGGWVSDWLCHRLGQHSGSRLIVFVGMGLGAVFSLLGVAVKEPQTVVWCFSLSLGSWIVRRRLLDDGARLRKKQGWAGVCPGEHWRQRGGNARAGNHTSDWRCIWLDCRSRRGLSCVRCWGDIVAENPLATREPRRVE